MSASAVDFSKGYVVPALPSQRDRYEAWSEPLPLRSRSVAPFPVDVLPEPVRSYVVALSDATQTPVDLPALVALGVVASASAKRIKVRARDGWEEPINLFVAAVQPPGALKSAVFRDATAPLVEWEAEQAALLGPEIKRRQARRVVAQKALERAQSEAAKASADGLAEALAEVDRLADELHQMPPAVLPRKVCDDATPEKLAALLHDHGECMAVMSAEGGVFGMMAGRYSSNGGANLDVYLKGHAGDSLLVDRIGRDPVRLDAPALTVCLTVQPDVIRRLADAPEFRGRGLLARWLYAWPASRVGGRDLAGARAVRAEVRAAYQAMVRRLLAVEGEATLTLAPEALETLKTFLRWIEPKLAEGGDLGLLADWGSKVSGASVRLAGLLHLAGNTPGFVVSLETMASALELARYFITHAELAFSEMGADRGTEDAELVLRYINRSGRDALSKRDLYAALPRGRFPKADSMERPLEILEMHGFIRWQGRPPEDPRPGRRPSPVFEVNPHSQNPHNPQNSTGPQGCADSADSADASEVLL